MKVTNKSGYAYHGKDMGASLEGTPTTHRRHKLEVTFILDTFVGPFSDPEDLIKWIASNPYVDTVEHVDVDPKWAVRQGIQS